MKVAVVGSGVSGLVAAWLLHEDHDVTVFEADARIGGHVHTVDVPEQAADGTARTHAVDTGFIVFNERTYPNFLKLLRRLGVGWRKSDMSFSVKCERTGLEYNGTSLDTLFAQRRNLVSPRFLRMVRDILRFNRDATRFARNGVGDDVTTLGAFVDRMGYSEWFVEKYLVPMGSAIWSAEPAGVRAFPFRTFARFFDHHGMLTVDDRPDWLVVEGGSRAYVEALVRPFRDRIRTSSPVRAVRRFEDRVEVVTDAAGAERFDHVILAAHADQTLRMLEDASAEERDVLGAFRYQPNDTVLHADASILPRRRKAWASWNYHLEPEETRRTVVTYWMNRLQGLDAARDYCVTLNRDHAIAPDAVLGRFLYEHPIFTREAVARQPSQARLNGRNRTSFAGAYWGYGFHEDGVKSALAACRPLGKEL